LDHVLPRFAAKKSPDFSVSVARRLARAVLTSVTGVRFGSFSWLVASGALLALGCNISPQPAPPGVTPEIRAEAITLTEIDPQSIELRGSQGAAPASASLRIANVEIAEADVAVETDAGGGFATVVPGQLSDVFRLGSTTTGGSVELDISGTTSGAAAAEVEPAFADCLTAAPEFLSFGEVGLGDPIVIQSITLTNECAQPLAVAAVSVRDGTEFVVLGPGPGQLPLGIGPGLQALVEIGFKSPTLGTFEDLVRVRFTDAAGPRRIFGASGTAGP
jgi:hypothetical protein